jgi:hypothetical protein
MINLATRYSNTIASVFTAGSFVKGKTSQEFDLTGVKTLKVYTPVTVPEVDYVRSGSNRYGTPVEMQDTVQELMMGQDKSFTLTIDKGNNEDQEMAKRAGDMLKLQINEQSTPAADKYALKRFANMAGIIGTVSSKPTKSNIIETICGGVQAMDDALVPDGDRYIYVSSEIYKLIRLSPEFTGNEELGKKALEKGVCGEISGLSIVKVPASYMPSDCFFIITHKNSVLFPYKISDAKIHTDPVGVSGAIIEGRHYYDAFVLGAKCSGVYACVLESSKVAVPIIAKSSGNITISCATEGSEILYTADGSDPRYSDSAKIYSAAFSEPEAGSSVRAFAKKDGMYQSASAELII